jgi:hypothetical protein
VKGPAKSGGKALTMNERFDGRDYDELKAELRSLHEKIADLNARLAGIAPASPSLRERTLSKALTYRPAVFFCLLGLVVGAVAQTSDPIAIGADGKVRIGTSLDVAERVKAPSFEGSGGALAVEGYGNVKQALDTLGQRIQTVQADTASKITSVNKRISGIALSETARGTLQDFSCGHEAIADRAFTYVVGSRDGTSCNVMNLVYVKTLSLTVPAQ